VRARQTAALLGAAWGTVEPTPAPALASGGVDAIVGLLESQARDATIGLVGHEPTMSGLVIEILGLMSSDAVTFSVGTAALLEVTPPIRRGGRLVWFLPAELAETLAGGAQ
jgi:phosphohistidine phosphatase SixA